MPLSTQTKRTSRLLPITCGVLVTFAAGLVSVHGGQAPARGQAAGPDQPAGDAQPQGRGGRGRGAQARPRKVLLAWADTRNGQAQHAFTSHALAIVERLGYDSGLWDTFIRTDSHIIFNAAQKTDGTPASGGPSLANVDGIFFLGHREVPINEQQKKELLDFVRGGKGFVAAHTGLTAFESWPEFGRMLGATYGGHLYTGPGRVISEQPANPIVKHWGSAFEYTDEFYRAGALSRDDVDVLLRFDPVSAPSSKLPQDGDFPLVWTKTYGQGRVVYSSLSHSTEAWDIRHLQLMMLEAIKWSLGLSEAPPQPHAKRDGAPASTAAPAR
jgi:type 1 glutamine amidotransferase